jgi:hypothetical protein
MEADGGPAQGRGWHRQPAWGNSTESDDGAESGWADTGWTRRPVGAVVANGVVSDVGGGEVKSLNHVWVCTAQHVGREK